MPLSLNIVPHVPTLDMYGSARPGTAYSLSGEVVLTLTSPTPSLFASTGAGSTSNASTLPKPTTIYLSSLVVIFEGKVEILSHNCGYAPYRLCQVEKELADGKPIALTNSGQSNGVMRWSMTFDLAIPGWLPASLTVDDQGSGTAYSLHARARFADDALTAMNASTTTSSAPSTAPGTPLGATVSSYFPAVPGLAGSLSLSAFNPFASFSRSKIKQALAAPVLIRVNRFRSPKSLNPFGGAPDFTAPLVPPQIYHPTASLFPVTLESVETRVNIPSLKDALDPEKKIPVDVLSGIEIVAGVPEYVGMNEEKIPLSLRVRSSNSASVNKGLVLEAFDVEVEQVEKFRSIPCERYTSTYPVPPASQQPPAKSLLNPNPLEGLFSLGLSAPSEPVQWTRTVPMLPTKRVNFRPSPATGGLEVDGEWAKMDLAITVLRKSDTEEDIVTDSAAQEEEKSGRNLRRKLLNPDFDSPLCRSRHDMKIALKLSWLPEWVADKLARKGLTGERMRKARMAHPERKTEILLMSLPVKLAQVSEGVERLYKTLNVHHGAAAFAAGNTGPLVGPAMRRALAQSQSRSTSPAPSLSGSSSFGSARTSPASDHITLPSFAAPSLSRSDTPVSSGSVPSSSSSSSHCSASSGLLPYAAVVSNFPGPFVLPPYSELYHANGDPKEHINGAWLPRYVEKEDLGSPNTLEAEDIRDLGLTLEA